MDFTSFLSFQHSEIKFSICLVSVGLLRMRRKKEGERVRVFTVPVLP